MDVGSGLNLNSLQIFNVTDFHPVNVEEPSAPIDDMKSNIISHSNASVSIDEFVHWNFRRIVNLEEIDVVEKMLTVFFCSACLDITILFRPFSTIWDCSKC